MQGRKKVYSHGMRAGDGKLRMAVLQQIPAQQTRVDTEVRAPESVLDGDFPERRSAEHRFRRPIFQQRAHVFR